MRKQQCWVLHCFASTSRYFFTQSKKTTLDLSSSSWDLSLESINLLPEPGWDSTWLYRLYRRQSRTFFLTAAVLGDGQPTFIFPLLQNEFLVEISSFLQVPCFNNQLLLQFLFKGKRTKSHKGLKITAYCLSLREACRCFQCVCVWGGTVFIFLCSLWQKNELVLLKRTEWEVAQLLKGVLLAAAQTLRRSSGAIKVCKHKDYSLIFFWKW